MSAARSLEELIEAERANLTQVRGMAKCLQDVLMYADDDDSLLHADVALVIARLIAESVDALGNIVSRLKAGEFSSPLGK